MVIKPIFSCYTDPLIRCGMSLCFALFTLSANGAEQVAAESSANLNELKKAFLESVQLDSSAAPDDEAESRRQKLQQARENAAKFNADDAAAKASEEAKELQRIELAEKEQKAAEAAIREQAIAEQLKQEKAESERQQAREQEKRKVFQAQEDANRRKENIRRKEERISALEMQNRQAEENIKRLEAQIKALAAENEAAALRERQREENVRDESGQNKTQTASDEAVATASNRQETESEIDKEPGNLEKVGNIGKGMVTKEAEKRAKKGASTVIKEAFDQVLPF